MSRRLWKITHQTGAVIIWLALAKNYLLIFFIPSLLGDRSIFYLGGFLVALVPIIRVYLIFRKNNIQKVPVNS